MPLRSFLSQLDTVASWLQSPFLLVVRLYWGLAFAQSGWGKATHLERVTAYFAELQIPLPKLNAIAAGSTELAGGILLVIGLFSRATSIVLIGTTVMAYATAEREAVQPMLADFWRGLTHLDFSALSSGFDNADKFVTATPFLFLLASLIVFVFGPGKLALDSFFGKKSGAAA